MNFVLLYNITGWLERNMLQCPSKKYLHIECFGCGFQRSFIAFLKGDIATSLKLYPATIPLLFTFFYTVLHLVFKFKNGAKIIQISFIATSLIIVISFIIKIFQHKVL